MDCARRRSVICRKKGFSFTFLFLQYLKNGVRDLLFCRGKSFVLSCPNNACSDMTRISLFQAVLRCLPEQHRSIWKKPTYMLSSSQSSLLADRRGEYSKCWSLRSWKPQETITKMNLSPEILKKFFCTFCQFNIDDSLYRG